VQDHRSCLLTLLSDKKSLLQTTFLAHELTITMQDHAARTSMASQASFLSKADKSRQSLTKVARSSTLQEEQEGSVKEKGQERVPWEERENVEVAFPQEHMQGTRFGVSPATLEKAHHLRDTVFPQAGVSLYIAHQQAYAVTSQQALVCVGPLEQLTVMSDEAVLVALDLALRAHHTQKRSLRELRVQARFFSQADLAHFINERFATPRKPSIISPRTIWRAENGHPIAHTTALLIVTALREQGIQVSVEHIDWVIGHQGKRGSADVASIPPSSAHESQ